MIAATILFLFLFLALPALAAGYQPLRIEPSHLVFEGKPGETITGSITVLNKGTESVTPKAILTDWTLDLYNKLVLVSSGASDSSLSGLIKFNPRQFTLKPQESQTVRFTVKIPRDASPGERRGMIAFEQLVAYKSKVGATAKVQVTSTVYVAIKPAKRTVEFVQGQLKTIKGLKDDPNAAATMIAIALRGNGTAHFRGNATFQIAKDGEKKPVAEGAFEPLVVLPQVTTRFLGGWKGQLDPGKYLVTITIRSEEAGTPPMVVSFEHVQNRSETAAQR